MGVTAIMSKKSMMITRVRGEDGRKGLAMNTTANGDDIDESGQLHQYYDYDVGRGADNSVIDGSDVNWDDIGNSGDLFL